MNPASRGQDISPQIPIPDLPGLWRHGGACSLDAAPSCGDGGSVRRGPGASGDSVFPVLPIFFPNRIIISRCFSKLFESRKGASNAGRQERRRKRGRAGATMLGAPCGLRDIVVGTCEQPAIRRHETFAQDSIAELLEIAPSIAISVLDDLLLTEPAAWRGSDTAMKVLGAGTLRRRTDGLEPATLMHVDAQRMFNFVEDTEDPHVHPLPHRANMNYKHRAQGHVLPRSLMVFTYLTSSCRAAERIFLAAERSD